MFPAIIPPLNDTLKKQLVSASPNEPAAVVATNEPMGISAGFTYSDF